MLGPLCKVGWEVLTLFCFPELFSLVCGHSFPTSSIFMSATGTGASGEAVSARSPPLSSCPGPQRSEPSRARAWGLPVPRHQQARCQARGGQAEGQIPTLRHPRQVTAGVVEGPLPFSHPLFLPGTYFSLAGSRWGESTPPPPHPHSAAPCGWVTGGSTRACLQQKGVRERLSFPPLRSPSPGGGSCPLISTPHSVPPRGLAHTSRSTATPVSGDVGTSLCPSPRTPAREQRAGTHPACGGC